MPGAPENCLCTFGDFTVDLDGRLLLHHNTPVPLTPKQFDTLEYMVLNAGRLLSKEELLKALWPDSFVEDSNLSQNVFWLRKAFRNGDSEASQPNYIVTIPGKGYRFDAAITVTHRPGHQTSPERQSPPPLTSARPKARLWPWFVVAGLAAAIAGTMLVRHRNRPHPTPVAAVSRRDIVVAQFANTTDDPALTGPLTTVLRIGLGQSPYLVTLPRTQVAETLAAMRLPADSPLTPDLAAQVCQRHHFTAVVAGAIATVGSTYVVTLEATDCVTGHVFSSGRTVAHKKDEIIPALDGLLPDLRTRLGESVPSVRQFTVDVEQTTTASLDAFKAFAAGDNLLLHGQSTLSIPYYEKAIALDPKFAMAYARLGSDYTMANDTAKSDYYFTKAFQLSGSMSSREKRYIAENYTRRVTSDIDESIRFSQQDQVLYPLDRAPWGGLDDALVQVGRFDDAVRVGEDGLRRFPDDAILHITLGRAYLRAGNFDGLKRVADDAAKLQMESWDLHEMMWNRAVLIGDAASEAAERLWVTGKPDEYQALDDDAFLNLRRGRALQAQVSQRAFLVLAARQSMSGYEDVDVGNFTFDLEEMGLHREAVALIHKYRPASPSPEIARGLAEAGDVKAAAALGLKLQQAHPKDTLINAWSLPIMQAAIDLRDPTPAAAQQALDALKPAERLGLRDFAAPYLRGKAYLKLGRLPEARAEFQRIADTPGADPFSPLYPLALLQLARTQAQANDLPASRISYQRVLSMWQGADANLPVLTQARQELAALK